MNKLVVILCFLISYCCAKCTNIGSFNIFYGNENEHDNDINKVIHKLKFVTIEFNELANYNKYLVIFHNSSIPGICEDLVSPLKDVRKLFFNLIGANHIEENAFNSLKYLDELGIYQNNMTTIQTGIFNGLPIRKLDIGGNNIEDIESEAFDDMPNLEYLRIIGNGIKVIDTEWFRNTPKLYELLLQHNKITELPKNVFKYLRTGSTCKYEDDKNNCPNISLVGNRIKKIHPDAFTNLRNITSINLTYNHIKELPNIFVGIRVKEFSIMDNDITCFSDDVLEAFKKIKIVQISGNNIRRECAEEIIL